MYELIMKVQHHSKPRRSVNVSYDDDIGIWRTDISCTNRGGRYFKTAEEIMAYLIGADIVQWHMGELMVSELKRRAGCE